MSQSALHDTAPAAVNSVDRARRRESQLWSVPMDGRPTSTRLEQDQAKVGWQRLLRFLAQGQTDVGKAYEKTRARLVDFFASRGELNCDELADLTFDRLVSKLCEEDLTAVRKPIGYTLRFARFIHLETVKAEVTQRRRLELLLPETLDDSKTALEQQEHQERLALIERCLAELSPDDRMLLTSYYQHTSGQERIASRKELGRALCISEGLLRTRVSRLCAEIERRALAVAAANGVQ